MQYGLSLQRYNTLLPAYQYEITADRLRLFNVISQDDIDKIDEKGTPRPSPMKGGRNEKSSSIDKDISNKVKSASYTKTTDEKGKRLRPRITTYTYVAPSPIVMPIPPPAQVVNRLNDEEFRKNNLLLLHPYNALYNIPALPPRLTVPQPAAALPSDFRESPETSDQIDVLDEKRKEDEQQKENEQRLERERIAEEKRKDEEAQRERERIAEEKRKEEEAQRERERIAEEKRKEEDARLERERIAEEKKKEEERLAEEQKEKKKGRDSLEKVLERLHQPHEDRYIKAELTHVELMQADYDQDMYDAALGE